MRIFRFIIEKIYVFNHKCNRPQVKAQWNYNYKGAEWLINFCPKHSKRRGRMQINFGGKISLVFETLGVQIKADL